jgi:hypothetical protein
MTIVDPDDLIIGHAYRITRHEGRSYDELIYVGRQDGYGPRGALVFRTISNHRPGSYIYYHLDDKYYKDDIIEEITDKRVVNRMGALRKKNSPFLRQIVKEFNPRSYMNLPGIDMSPISRHNTLAAQRLTNPTTLGEVAYKQRAPLLAHREEHTIKQNNLESKNNSSKGGKRRKTMRKTRRRSRK